MKKQAADEDTVNILKDLIDELTPFGTEDAGGGEVSDSINEVEELVRLLVEANKKVDGQNKLIQNLQVENARLKKRLARLETGNT